MKMIKTHTIILFLITLTIGLAAASCDHPTGDQMQAQEEEPVAEAETSFDAMSRFPGFAARDIKTFICPARSAAIFDAFLKLEGVPGEATDPDHEEEIEILSFSLGASIRATSTLSGHGPGKAKAAFNDVIIVKEVDKASPALRRFADTGEPIPEGVLTLRMTCGEEEVETESLTIELEDVVISSYQSTGSSGSSRQVPTEKVTFNYSKIALILPAVQKAREAAR